MTTGSGRCHGPGCTQTAVTEYWCSERCQQVWAAQFGDPTTKMKLDAMVARLDAAADAARRQALDPPPQVTYSGTASSVMEDILRAYDLIGQVAPPEPVKLTQSQWDALRAANPPLMSRYGVGGVLGDLSGVPIELVDDERDSTLYRPPVEAVGVFEAFEVTPTFGVLPPAVDGDSTERVCEPSAPDPSRGWLSRWLDRLFGRTT